MFKLIEKLMKKMLSNLNNFEVFLLLFMCWASIWPLFYPNWRTNGYKQISDNDIESDLEICRNNSKSKTNQINDCPLIAPNLVEYFDVLTKTDHKLIESIPAIYDISRGGRHEPRECMSSQRVAIIVPFRDRWTHLSIFVQHIHRFLSRQLIDYTIFIVEQNDTKAFNRGKLFNVGFIEANKLDRFCCFIFHDIDLLPSNQKQLYYCSQQPRHMCSALDKFRYVLIYPDLLGGAVAITKTQYQLVNGYSNQFEGWGGEDDDFSNRIKDKSLVLTRWSPHISRCLMLKHSSEKPNPNRNKLLNEGKNRFDSDGLIDVSNSYQLIAINFEPLYTLIKTQFI